MAALRAFERELRIASAGLSDQEISRLLAETARSALAEAQIAGEFPEQYITAVNGRIGGNIDAVVPPGPIVFTADWWPEIITYGLEFARERSPVKSGRYKDSWFVMINGTFTTDFSAVPFDAECIVTNDVPYARKIEVGAQHVSVPPGVVEDTCAALRRRFGNLIRVRRQFINLAGAYRLRNSSVRRRRTRQRGTRGEHLLTYPASIISMAA